MVEQCDVPVESRISALEMELRLCKQQIANYDNKALVGADSSELFGELWDKCLKNLMLLSMYHCRELKIGRLTEQKNSWNQ